MKKKEAEERWQLGMKVKKLDLKKVLGGRSRPGSAGRLSLPALGFRMMEQFWSSTRTVDSPPTRSCRGQSGQISKKRTSGLFQMSFLLPGQTMWVAL